MKFEKLLAVMVLIVAVLFVGYCAPAKACDSGVALVNGVPVVVSNVVAGVQVADLAFTNPFAVRSVVAVNSFASPFAVRSVRISRFGGFGASSVQVQTLRSRGVFVPRSSVSRTVIRTR